MTYSDATNLQPIPNHAFDLVVSVFGAMFAPKPFDAAKEMVRVTRPGGRIVMATGSPAQYVDEFRQYARSGP